MEFNIGDRVRFLNDEGEGKIIAFLPEGMAMVEDTSGFAFEHSVTELVPVKDPAKEWRGYRELEPDINDIVERNTDSKISKKVNDDFKLIYKKISASNERRRGETLEVDLHAHELLDRHEHLSPGEIVKIQMEHFERMLRNAEEHKIHRIIFIHGVGQGVLRAEIRKLLHHYYPHCEFMDAPYHQYGQGATEVRIRPNFRR
ncbi:MAG: Smr/MutS family protein [Crocinitomicaceae bacterium]|nr:Smr/MutS family protein [Crocinitomicaceae bacterium]